MSAQPPTAICGGITNNELELEKPRVLLTNPETKRGSVHSTDQTAKGRPEWVFPRCPTNIGYMVGCSHIITDHDKENKLPTDLAVLQRDVWDNGKPLDFVVRFHATGSSLNRSLARTYSQHDCPHGIIVVVPCNSTISHMLLHPMSDSDKEDMRKALDMSLLKLLVEEEKSVQCAMEQHERRRDRRDRRRGHRGPG